MQLTSNILFSVVLIFFVMSCVNSESGDEFLLERHRIRKNEKQLAIGGNIKLTSKENEANKLILRIKQEELDVAYKNESEFLPSQHFFLSKPKIEQSKVFSIIRKLPKGSSLHTHMLAGVSVDYIILNMTYMDQLYGCFVKGTFKLRFLEKPNENADCVWKSLVEYRKEDVNFDKWLKGLLTLETENPNEVYPSQEAVWSHFKKIFTTMYDMICYRPVFEMYITRLLNELYEDNVMYIELRGTFMPLYELNGTVYDAEQFFTIFIGIVDKFKAQHPRFIGARFIHSVYRGVSPEVLKAALVELTQLQSQFPDFIIGFDFVGYEEEGHQLVDYREVLLEFSGKVKFFFHAGETSWYGHTDLNLIDAVLLNTTRIGHGFALPKHPLVMDMVKVRKIPVEVAPISNQVLMLNRDPRNHPAVFLIAQGFPLVICNDDPAIWGASGLSYDWYVVFMAMLTREGGIAELKQFAIDSILYSEISNEVKDNAIKQWDEDWNKFVDYLIQNFV